MDSILKESRLLKSVFLEREVTIDFYFPTNTPAHSNISLLLFNDGQDLQRMMFEEILAMLMEGHKISPVLCVGIHAGKDRKNEYGTANSLDYKGRGAKASAYTRFVFEELIPFIRITSKISVFKEKAFAGFSLGALSALDIAWNAPAEFSKIGVFSGSLWWRTKDQDAEDYNDDTDRIMHQQIRKGSYYPWLKFFFECGAADEEDDRNHNGIIDSIDDTLDLIKELINKGYNPETDIEYLQIDDGKHDVDTWARAMPDFFLWGWGESREFRVGSQE